MPQAIFDVVHTAVVGHHEEMLEWLPVGLPGDLANQNLLLHD